MAGSSSRSVRSGSRRALEAFAFGSAGQFIGAFHDEFGWDRTEVSFGLLILTGMTALSLPFIGRLIDRYGARRVLIPSLVLFAACLAAIPLFVRELWQLNLVYVLMGTVAAGTNSVPFVRVIAAWFDRSRGLAIGIAGSGTGLGFAYVPLVVEYMTTHHGWRSAYYALAAIVLAITLPLVLHAVQGTTGRRRAQRRRHSRSHSIARRTSSARTRARVARCARHSRNATSGC